jgi:CDP-diacylglycerol--glycerol-3-phosphate 3-phosphatidyltransferase
MNRDAASMKSVRTINAANAITSVRLVLAPLFVVAYAFAAIWPGFLPPAASISALWALFLVMELSDVVDGVVARRQGVSDLGKILDPFADVVCRMTYFICLTVAGIIPLWFVIVVLYREFAAVFLRLLLYRKGYALGARTVGKLKSWFYSLATAAALFIFTVRTLPGTGAGVQNALRFLRPAAYVVYVVAAILALWSLANYLVFYRSHARNGSRGTDGQAE